MKGRGELSSQCGMQGWASQEEAKRHGSSMGQQLLLPLGYVLTAVGVSWFSLAWTTNQPCGLWPMLPCWSLRSCRLASLSLLVPFTSHTVQRGEWHWPTSGWLT